MRLINLSSDGGLTELFDVNQYDTAQNLEFQTVQTIEAEVIEWVVGLGDNLYVSGSADYTADGICSFTLPLTATLKDGLFEAQVSWYMDEAKKERISTFPFYIRVQKSPVQSGSVQAWNSEKGEQIKEELFDAQAVAVAQSRESIDAAFEDYKASTLTGFAYYKQELEEYFTNLKTSIAELSDEVAFLNRLTTTEQEWEKTLQGCLQEVKDV